MRMDTVTAHTRLTSIICINNIVFQQFSSVELFHFIIRINIYHSMYYTVERRFSNLFNEGCLFLYSNIISGKRRRLPSPIERRVSDDQEHVINDYPSQYSDPHIRSSNQCNKILNVDFLNEHVHTGNHVKMF